MRGDKTKRLLVVVVGLFIIGGFIVIPSLDSLSFSWGIDEGEVFVYHLVFIRTTPEHWTQQPTWPFPLIHKINNSMIWINVTQLPSTVLILNGGAFIANIVNRNKITCTLENGTEINQEALNLISRCILPIDGWDSIDSWFPSFSESLGLYPDTHMSEISNEFFRFGYVKFISDDVTNRWYGYINMTTGIPVNMTQSYFDLSYLDVLTITLVDII